MLKLGIRKPTPCRLSEQASRTGTSLSEIAHDSELDGIASAELGFMQVCMIWAVWVMA